MLVEFQRRIDFSAHISEKYSNIKFYDNSGSGIGDLQSKRQT
jgi:hypothetical protein